MALCATRPVANCALPCSSKHHVNRDIAHCAILIQMEKERLEKVLKDTQQATEKEAVKKLKEAEI